MNLGSRIEKIRKGRGLTRKRLAHEIKEPIHVIRALEYGSVPKGIETVLPKIAKALEVSLNELFGLPPNGNGAAKTARQIESLVKKLIAELNSNDRYSL